MLNMTTTADAATTGMKEIAGALGGGIRDDSMMIIEGEAKAGKSVLSQHLTYGALNCKDNAVVYYTTESSIEDMIAQMDSMSLPTKHDFVTDRLRIYSLNSPGIFENSPEFLRLLVKHISELPKRFNLVVVDSITPFMNQKNSVINMDFLQSCKELCEQGRSIILAVGSHVFDERTLYRTYLMSDYYLKIKSNDTVIGTGQVDERVLKTLEVTKLGGAERQPQEGIKFEIKPKVGIQILPFVTVKA